MPNRIDMKALPKHILHQFSNEGKYVQIGGLHADAPDDLVQLWVIFYVIRFNVTPALDSYEDTEGQVIISYSETCVIFGLSGSGSCLQDFSLPK